MNTSWIKQRLIGKVTASAAILLSLFYILNSNTPLDGGVKDIILVVIGGAVAFLFARD